MKLLDTLLPENCRIRYNSQNSMTLIGDGLMAQMMAAVQTAQLRLVNYYIRQLRDIGAMYARGGDNTVHALAAFDANYPQIEPLLHHLFDNADYDPEQGALLVDMLANGTVIFQERLPADTVHDLYQRASTIAKRQGKTQEMLTYMLSVAQSLRNLGRHEERTHLLEQVCDFARKAGETAILAEALMQVSYAYEDFGETQDAILVTQEALTLYRSLNDLNDVALALLRLGQIESQRGDWQLAEDHLRQSEAIMQQTGSQKHLAALLHDWGKLLNMTGRRHEALERLQVALKVARSMGQEWEAQHIIIQVAAVYDVLGDFAAAEQYYLEALDYARQMGSVMHQAIILGNLGYSTYLQEKYQAALDCIEESLLLLQQQKIPYLICIAYANITPVYVAFGSMQAAQDAVYNGMRIAVEIENAQFQVMMVVAAVQLYVGMGQAATDAEQSETLMMEAARWAGLVQSHPQAEEENRSEIDKLLPQLSAHLGENRVRALMAEGEQLMLEHVVGQILSL